MHFFVISYKNQAIQIFHFPEKHHKYKFYQKSHILFKIGDNSSYSTLFCIYLSLSKHSKKKDLSFETVCLYISSFPSYVKLTCERTAKNNIKKLPEDKGAKSTKGKI